jgi:uncharacterized cupredoxin-like copper-binding protein
VVRRFVFLLPAVLVLAACGGGSSSSSKQGAVIRTIQISEKEFSLTPRRTTVSGTGTYAFRAVNDGTTTHALEIEGNGVEEKTSEIAPGSTKTLRVTFSKDGSYDIYCPVDGHRQQGMKGVVVVGNAAGSGGNTTNGQTTTTRRPGY